MNRIGLSVPSFSINEEMFQKLSKAGITAIEVCHSRKEHLEYDNFEKFAEWSKQYGVELWSYHLPFYDRELRFDISHDGTADNTVALFCNIIKEAAAAGIKRFIVHPSAEPIKDEDRSAKMERSKKTLLALAEFADTVGAVICVEDLPRTCLGRNSAELMELISVHPSLRVCFDTNHLLSEPFVDFIHALGDKIVTLHVSDYDFIDEKHWLPGEGLVDWHLLYRTLCEVGYDQVWLYELGFHHDGLNRSRDLTCEDFVQNAREIFEGKPITTLLVDKQA